MGPIIILYIFISTLLSYVRANLVQPRLLLLPPVVIILLLLCSLARELVVSGIEREPPRVVSCHGGATCCGKGIRIRHIASNRHLYSEVVESEGTCSLL